MDLLLIGFYFLRWVQQYENSSQSRLGLDEHLYLEERKQEKPKNLPDI